MKNSRTAKKKKTEKRFQWYLTVLKHPYKKNLNSFVVIIDVTVDFLVYAYCNQNRDKKGVYVSGLQTTNFTTITRAKLNFGLWVMGVFAVWKAQKKKHYLCVTYFRICARCTPSFLCWSFQPTFWPCMISRGVAIAMNRWKPVRSFFLWYNPFRIQWSSSDLPRTIRLVHSLKSADFWLEW